MNKINEIPNSNPIIQEEENNLLKELDLHKLGLILRKSLIWIILINGLALLGAFTFLRYTKPLYESSSALKLDMNENQRYIQEGYGIFKTDNDNLKELLGELEFIRSEIISKMVIDCLDLTVSYFSKGNFLDSEMYTGSPFEVKAKIHNPIFFGKVFDLRFLDNTTYELTCKIDDKNIFRKQFKFDKLLSNKDFEIEILFHGKDTSPHKYNDYYFIIRQPTDVIAYLQKNLDVGIRNKDARIIAISFKDYNPFKARDIVTIIDSVYMEKSIETKNQSNKQRIKWINGELQRNEDSLIFYEAQTQNFFLENKTKDIDDKLGKSIEELEGLIGQKQQVAKKLAILLELEDAIQSRNELKEFIPLLEILDNEQLAQEIRNFNKEKESKEILELSQKSDKTYRSQKSTKLLDNAREDLKVYTSAYRKVLLEELRDYNGKIIEIQSSFIGFPLKGRELNRITRQYKLFDGYYSNLLNKKTELEIAGAGIVPEFTILSPANFPVVPIYPEKFWVYAIASSLGMFLSISLVGGRYLLHNAISSQADLEKLTSAPVLGSIPEYRRLKLKTSQLIIGNNPKSSINEAFRSIRTNLDFILPSGKGIYSNASSTVIMVTSTVSGEGKTFVVANLGGIIATSDLKVIALDFDMRKPRLHQAFNQDNQQGISSILIGRQSISECIKTTEMQNLHIITSGPTPPNPSELILREDFDMMLDKLKESYDVIVIDTPPVGLVTDAVLIMQKVDVCLYVTRANYTKKFFAKTIKKIMSNNNLGNLALILNAVKKNSSYGGYGFGYGKFGGYGGYYGDGYYEDQETMVSKMIKRINKKNK
ncbi:MAG: polysaccharide biosynthesis tyrosine autokinase [Microscillaceae bacterium]|nr:polysaccharide biosynthesis tyrosine autokinase [Microscillaceae bacterium]